MERYEKGNKIIEEKGSRFIQKRLTIIVIFLLIVILITLGILENNFPTQIILLYFITIFIFLIIIIISIFNIVQIKIYENGFIPDYRPFSYSIRKKEYWISYKDIDNWEEKQTLSDTILIMKLYNGKDLRFSKRGITQEIYFTLIKELEKNCI